MARRGRVGAHEQVAVVGDRGVRRPDLLTVDTTYSSPSRRALVRSEARSEPASGSEKPWHQTTSPRTMRRQVQSPSARRCRGAMIDGPIQLTFMYCGPRGSPTDHSSSPRMMCCHGVAARPPCSAGQCGVSQPRSASRRLKTFEWATFSGDPSWRTAPRHSPSSAEATNECSSSRNAASSSDQPNSNGPPTLPNSAVPDQLDRRLGGGSAGNYRILNIDRNRAPPHELPWITATSEAGVDGAPVHEPGRRPRQRVARTRRRAASCTTPGVGGSVRSARRPSPSPRRRARRRRAPAGSTSGRGRRSRTPLAPPGERSGSSPPRPGRCSRPPT